MTCRAAALPHIGLMMHRREGPTIEEMRLMAMRALASLPDEFRAELEDLVLDVTDFATSEQLQSVGLDDAWELSGLYEGQSLPDRSIWETAHLPPRIWLFRKPLIAEWRETGVEMEALVRHVVIHEAGHHFGFSDDEMHALEDEAD